MVHHSVFDQNKKGFLGLLTQMIKYDMNNILVLKWSCQQLKLHIVTPWSLDIAKPSESNLKSIQSILFHSLLCHYLSNSIFC